MRNRSTLTVPTDQDRRIRTLTDSVGEKTLHLRYTVGIGTAGEEVCRQAGCVVDALDCDGLGGEVGLEGGRYVGADDGALGERQRLESSWKILGETYHIPNLSRAASEEEDDILTAAVDEVVFGCAYTLTLLQGDEGFDVALGRGWCGCW